MNRASGRFTQRKSIGAYLFTCSKSKTLMSFTAVKATQKCHPPATKVNGKRFSKNYQTGGRFLGKSLPTTLGVERICHTQLPVFSWELKLRQSTAFV